jgi:enoyl-CoA hydratase
MQLGSVRVPTEIEWEPSEATHALLEARIGRVALARLHRPEVRNALSAELLVALRDTLERFDADPSVHAIVLTGGERFFAAGADIGTMAGATSVEIASRPQLDCWHRLRQLSKPLIAAVNGFAFGGGAELVWLCDLVTAGESARFGQLEIGLGLMPGGGGTQRLAHTVGKARTMEIVLLGEPFSAYEALALGLVNRVVPDELVLTTALRFAELIAAKSTEATIAAKAAVLAAYELPLSAGLNAERAGFNALFDTEDAQEGMSAFLEKRKPIFGRDRS